MTAKPVDVAIRRVRNRAISRITRGCSRDDQPGCSYRPDLGNRRTHKGNRGTHKRNRGTHKGADTRSNTRAGYTTSPLQGRRNRSRGQFRRTVLSPDSMETPGRTELRQTRSAFRLSLTDGLLLYLTCSPPNFWSVMSLPWQNSWAIFGVPQAGLFSIRHSGTHPICRVQPNGRRRAASRVGRTCGRGSWRNRTASWWEP